MATAIADSHLHMNAISHVAAEAEAGVNPSILISRLMQELVLAAERTSELEKRLIRTSGELDVLRESLSQAQKHANTDPLTGLANRRAVDEFIQEAIVAARQRCSPVGLMMIDVDHFKHINDRFGHVIGDQVLKLLATVVRDRLRDGYLAGRYGGEELIAVLPGASIAVCAEAAEKIRRSIAECSLKRRSTGELLPTITVSIGVAELDPTDTSESFIERCDMAMYQAKKDGRNQIATAPMLMKFVTDAY